MLNGVEQLYGRRNYNLMIIVMSVHSISLGIICIFKLETEESLKQLSLFSEVLLKQSITHPSLGELVTCLGLVLVHATTSSQLKSTRGSWCTLKKLNWSVIDQPASLHHSQNRRAGSSSTRFRSGLKDTSEPLECIVVWSLRCACHVTQIDLSHHRVYDWTMTNVFNCSC